jgi:hypothetical protein
MFTDVAPHLISSISTNIRRIRYARPRMQLLDPEIRESITLPCILVCTTRGRCDKVYISSIERGVRYGVGDRDRFSDMEHRHDERMTKRKNDDNHHASVTTPPYCAGNSLTSMSGISSFPIVRGPWPTTFILASVAGDKIGLKSQKIHVMIEGTLTKNFRAWDRRSGLPGGGKQYKAHARGTRDNGPEIWW